MKLAMIAMLTGALLVQPVSADERGRHYEHAAAQPKSAEEAKRVLKDTIAEMAENVAKKDYEEVHEASYSLESAVNYLKNDKNNAELAKKQLELIELYTDLVHHGSEDGKFDKVHRYFPILEAEVLAYLSN